MKRIIEYRVTGPDKTGVSPSTRQWGGMQYEDKATEIIFNIGELHSEDIEGIVWRIDFDSSSAGYSAGKILEVIDGMVSRLLEYDMTRFGGEIQVTLIGTKLNEDCEQESIAYFIPVKVYLTEVEQHGESAEEIAPSISGAEASALDAAARAKESEETAKKAADEAKEANEKTQTARISLEKDAVFVFLGGDARQRARVVEIVIDGDLSQTSENAVQNKVITGKIDELSDAGSQIREEIEGISQDAKEYADGAAADALEGAKSYFDGRIIVSESQPSVETTADGVIWIKPITEVV